MIEKVLKSLQLTVAIIKPDAVAHPHVLKNIQQMILEQNFLFVRSSFVRLQRRDAEKFYAEHEGRFFHNRLVTFMSSGPISVHLLARYNAISEWRTLMGPTKVYRSQHIAPDTIRGKYGLTDTRNSTHGSDSEESAKIEAHFFFPTFNWDEWYRTEEPLFREGHVTFVDTDHVHIVNPDKLKDSEAGLTSSIKTR